MDDIVMSLEQMRAGEESSSEDSSEEVEESIEDIRERLKNVDINDNQGDSTSFLQDAVIWGQYNTCVVLIEMGARLDGVDTETGFTTMHYAADSGRADVCELLLTNGTTDQLDIPNPKGETALHLSAMRSYASVATVLVKYGAHVDAVDAEGRTALHAAVYEGRSLDLMKMLVQNGASLVAKHSDGSTPLDLALRNLEDESDEDFDGPNDPSVKLWRTYFCSMACHGIEAPPNFRPALFKLMMQGLGRPTVVGRHPTARSALAAMRSAF